MTQDIFEKTKDIFFGDPEIDVDTTNLLLAAAFMFYALLLSSHSFQVALNLSRHAQR